MKLLQFAVASIVDANTGHGLAPLSSSVSNAELERKGRAIRSRSILDLFGLIREKLADSISSYQARIRNKRELAVLAKLDDRLLKDVGLAREDIYAAQSGAISMEQLEATRNRDRQIVQVKTVHNAQPEPRKYGREAVNEAVFSEAKCA